MRVSPKYTDADWNAAFDGQVDWDKAIAIVEDRIRGRWLDMGGALLAHLHSGFAVIAIDCIVIESMWGFMHGERTPSKDPQVYREILTGSRFGWSTAESDSFRKSVRHAIMHDAETRGWEIQKTKPKGVRPQKSKNGDWILNRTEFHKALKESFADWLVLLRNARQALRENMRKRMEEIIKP